MINIAFIKYSLENLRKRKLRSWLTIVSVLIGIAAITSLVSFGYGISAYVNDISQQMGNDKLIIQPRGMGFGPSIDSNVHLDEDDLDAVRSVKGVAEAAGVYMVSAEVSFDKHKKYTLVIGSDYEHYPELFREVYALKLLEGTELRGKEKAKGMFGYSYTVDEKLFPNALKLRDHVVVNGYEIQVAGFYDEVGNPEDDAHIYVTKDAAETLFNATNYQFLLVRSAPGVEAGKLAEVIARELRDHRHQKRGHEDFFVQTFEQVVATFTSVLGVITAVVVLIAFISLIVAAVNIMNTMYASILERTKEIGVLKAIGSENREILFLFMFESGTLSFVGGVLGVLLGYGVSHAAGNAIQQSGYGVFTPLFSWQLVVGSLLFALLVGVLAGYFPARRASKLRPIEALRYE